jgi:hypothetical protein
VLELPLKRLERWKFLPLAASVLASACSTSNRGENAMSMSALTDAFAQFEASVFREPETGIYIVDGDTPIESRQKLLEAFHAFNARGSLDGDLIVRNVGGTDAKWDDTQKLDLTYCVSATAFAERRESVVTSMADAAAAWQGVAHVRFVHVEAEDSNCTNTNDRVTFDVNTIAHNQYFARSFFPDSARDARSVLIDNSSFGTLPPNLTLTGILRHELGHVLGFRHEHIRPEAHFPWTPAACFEDGNWRPLTAYDWHSVMHYQDCSGPGDWTFNLSDRDKIGSAELYGAPLPN